MRWFTALLITSIIDIFYLGDEIRNDNIHSSEDGVGCEGSTVFDLSIIETIKGLCRLPIA